MDMIEIIMRAIKKNQIEVVDPEKSNLNLRERAREYLEALEEITEKTNKEASFCYHTYFEIIEI